MNGEKERQAPAQAAQWRVEVSNKLPHLISSFTRARKQTDALSRNKSDSSRKVYGRVSCQVMQSDLQLSGVRDYG